MLIPVPHPALPRISITPLSAAKAVATGTGAYARDKIAEKLNPKELISSSFQKIKEGFSKEIPEVFSLIGRISAIGSELKEYIKNAHSEKTNLTAITKATKTSVDVTGAQNVKAVKGLGKIVSPQVGLLQKISETTSDHFRVFKDFFVYTKAVWGDVDKDMLSIRLSLEQQLAAEKDQDKQGVIQKDEKEETEEPPDKNSPEGESNTSKFGGTLKNLFENPSLEALGDLLKTIPLLFSGGLTPLLSSIAIGAKSLISVFSRFAIWTTIIVGVFGGIENVFKHWSEIVSGSFAHGVGKFVEYFAKGFLDIILDGIDGLLEMVLNAVGLGFMASTVHDITKFTERFAGGIFKVVGTIITFLTFLLEIPFKIIGAYVGALGHIWDAVTDTIHAIWDFNPEYLLKAVKDVWEAFKSLIPDKILGWLKTIFGWVGGLFGLDGLSNIGEATSGISNFVSSIGKGHPSSSSSSHQPAGQKSYQNYLDKENVAARTGNVSEAEAWQAAQQSQHSTGIPAQVTYAQWVLESGKGKHMPAGSNNPFGIKAKAGQPAVEAMTTEYVNGIATKTTQAFKKFDSLADAFTAHAKLLESSPRYAEARKHENDPAKFADALTGVYATDPMYGDKLKHIMQKEMMITPNNKNIQIADENSTNSVKFLYAQKQKEILQQKAEAKKKADEEKEKASSSSSPAMVQNNVSNSTSSVVAMNDPVRNTNVSALAW